MYRQRVGDYYVGRTIGEGTFAKVKYGQHVDTGETVAIKVLEKEMVERAKLAPQIKKEIAIMRRLRHPNVVDLRHVMATRSHIYLVLELVTGGELFERVAGSGPLREADARRWFVQLVDGLAHCHARGVFHRDLKLENILLTASGDVKLSDFGLGAVREAAQQSHLLHTVCGTPNYAAPEVLQRKAYHGAPADIWSLGVCLYIMLAGCLPFDERGVGALLRKIAVADYEMPPWISQNAASLLRSILVPDPTRRATIEDVRRHPWVTAGGAALPPPAPLPDADDPVNEFTFNEAANLATIRERISSPRGVSSPGKLGGRKHLNAFELLGSAMDISSLFEGRRPAEAPLVRRATRFTSRADPADIAAAVEQATAHLGGRCERTDFDGLPSLRLAVSAGRGPLTVLVEVGDLVPGLRLVQFHRARGDSIDFFQFYGALLPLVSHIVARAPNGQDPLSPSNSGALAEAAAAFPITPPVDGASPTVTSPAAVSPTAKTSPAIASPRSPLSEHAAGANSAGDLASLSEGSKPAIPAAAAGAASPAADQAQLPQQRPQPPSPVAVPGAAPGSGSAVPPPAASPSPFSAVAAQQWSAPPRPPAAGAPPPPAPLAVPGRSPAGMVSGNSGPHSYSPNEYLLDDCSDEEFAADVEKLTLHEPVCSPSMASFGDGFNDYMNGMRPPRSSLDGRKLSTVRAPSATAGGTSSGSSGSSGGGGGAPTGAVGSGGTISRTGSRPQRLRGALSGGVDGAEIQPAPREGSMEWRSSKEVLQGWSATKRGSGGVE